MYYIKLKCGESYNFIRYRAISFRGHEGLIILKIEIQRDEKSWYELSEIWLRTIEDTNVPQLINLIKEGK